MDKTEIKKREARSLMVAMIGNLFMGAAGVIAAILSNSTAILMDGMFSLIGFTAALIGRRISLNSGAAPDRFRPFGYAADEALFVTFRSLSLIGLIMFACGSAGMNIYNYVTTGETKILHYGPMMVYFLLIGTTCFGLWAMHHFTWSKTGKVSEILRLEAKAAMIDGFLTVATFLGLGAIFLLGDGLLAPIAPIGDSIVVLLLCLAAVGQIWREFLSSIGELLGVTAKPEVVAQARRAVRNCLVDAPGRLKDVSVVKSGRTYLISVYYDPQDRLEARQVDDLNLAMIRDARKVLPESDVVLFVSQYPRFWPEDIETP